MRRLLTLLLIFSLTPQLAFADRLWSSGAELNSATSAVEWDTVTGGGVTVVTSPKRSGSYALDILKTSTGAIETIKENIRASVVSTDDCFRGYLNITTAVNTLIPIMQFTDTAGTAKTSIRLATDNTLELWKDLAAAPAKLGSSSSALSTGTWYKVELCATYTTGTATGYLDGSSFASGVTTAITTNAILNVGFVASATGHITFDDMAWNDNGGSSQTGQPGTGSITHLHPNATGDNSNGTPTGAATGWQCTNEVPPDDATTYQSLTTVNDILDVNIESSSTGGIGASDTITLVQVGYRGAESSASSNTENVRIKSQASGTTTSGTSTTHDDTTYRTNGDAIPRLYTLTSYVDPQAGGAWTTSLLDTAQIGFKNTVHNANSRLTNLWALVEYVPAAATNTPTPTATFTPTNTPTATPTPTITPTPTSTPTPSANLLPLMGVGK